MQIMQAFDQTEYAKILDEVVVTCVDVLVFDEQGNVLLGRRTRLPLLSWWLFGGRMKARETIEQATRRAITRELGVENYEYKGVIGHYLLDWPMRFEPPQENGCTHLLLATKIVLERSSLPTNIHVEAHD